MNENREMSAYERLTREQQLDVHDEEAQLECSDVLVVDEHAIAIEGDIERRLMRREIRVLLIAAERIDVGGAPASSSSILPSAANL